MPSKALVKASKSNNKSKSNIKSKTNNKLKAKAKASRTLYKAMPNATQKSSTNGKPKAAPATRNSYIIVDYTYVRFLDDRYMMLHDIKESYGWKYYTVGKSDDGSRYFYMGGLKTAEKFTAHLEKVFAEAKKYKTIKNYNISKPKPIEKLTLELSNRKYSFDHVEHCKKGCVDL